MSFEDERRKLQIEEFKVLNSRIDVLLKDIANFEIVSLAAYIGFYSWLFTSNPKFSGIENAIYFGPSFIAFYTYARIRWRIESVGILEGYIRQIENDTYGSRGMNKPNGYESYYQTHKGKRRWSKAREWLFLSLILLSLTFAAAQLLR